MLQDLFPRFQKRDDAEHAKSDEGSDSVLDGLTSLEYYERMTRFVRGASRHWVKSKTVIDFRPLYAVSIHHQQRQITQEIRAVYKNNMTDEQLETIRKLLKQYSKSPSTLLRGSQNEKSHQRANGI